MKFEHRDLHLFTDPDTSTRFNADPWVPRSGFAALVLANLFRLSYVPTVMLKGLSHKTDLAIDGAIFHIFYMLQ